MFLGLAKKIFGTVNERMIKTMHKRVEAINAFEQEMQLLSDKQLQEKTHYFKTRFAAEKKQGKTAEVILDTMLEEVFAVVREASRRILKMRHFDVQLLGGIILHKGMIAEMKTGEGKTLVATLPVYLNALTGQGVHVVTVNDYLAKRDSEWMGALYRFLGLTVSCVLHGLDEDERREAYAADITHGTNNEFGFDYLRDNMKFAKETMVQRGFHYAIIDEVDSILIDEARTPLIISGPTEDNSELYYQVDKLIPHLCEDDYEVDEKAKSVVLTEEGTEKMENILRQEGLLPKGASLYELQYISLVHHLNQALRAHKLFTIDKDYIVRDNKVMIIDEFTGRMMEGRRYSDGLHQALEAKEQVAVQNENQTLASITFQNYFRLYPKIAGMTGTAMTEAGEFMDIYKLPVVDIPPNVSVIRQDDNDVIYRTAHEKHQAIIEVIESCHAKKQPVLVGTVSIEKSEEIAALLQKKKIPHHVLNAKHHEKEASIIAQAGRPGAVTIATNMAGRGTDIMLGGNAAMLFEEQWHMAKHKADADALKADIQKQIENDKQQVIAAGGLYVLGTERHESRRIDNQLRGRAGRQGDPGASKFFLSLEDDLMRIFGSDRISTMLKKLGLKEGEAITHPWINRSIEKAQQRVEGHNFDMRKNLLKFDDVMNDQRKVIYEQRIELMENDDVSDTIQDMRQEVMDTVIKGSVPLKSYHEQWDITALDKEIFRVFGLHLPLQEWAQGEGVGAEEYTAMISKELELPFSEKEEQYGAHVMRAVEKKILLLTMDQLWKEHLLALDHLRQGIGLRAYGQKDPLNEYKREAFYMFEEMLDKLREVVTMRIAHMSLAEEDEARIASIEQQPPHHMQESRNDPAFAGKPEAGAFLQKQPVGQVLPKDRNPADPSTWGKVMRNEACPCNSGRKYKQCHGAL